MAQKAVGAADENKMPMWRQPDPLGPNGMLDFWERFFPLRVYNSLTRTKTRFIPRDGKRVLWYMCGPTVYAPSHMGHARTYLHFDILRRIMSDFFGYDVLMCMCITDIDDKIINRSREQGKTFRELAAFYEEDFMQDVAALGIKPVEVVTRVSEFIEEIKAFLRTVVDNGYAYESNGSLYFDVAAYHKHNNHAYAKLVPESVGNSELLAEGEGALSANTAADKRSPSDFALWKRSKEGEPSWDSEWGAGRPGWHIECSVMASKTFADLGGGGLSSDGCMDVHSGGVDLRFPHHDNELAQSEAYLDTGKDQWVNYFLHTGHLHIKGFKMSKSLKNFITIKQALTTHSARQVRLLFLLHKYSAPMDYGDSTMEGALVMEKTFAEFFHNVKAVLRNSAPEDSLRLQEAGNLLMNRVSWAQDDVNAALCDDFDTPRAMRALQEVVVAANKYLEDKDAAKQKPCKLPVRRAADFVTRILKTFGVIPAGEDIGFPSGEGEGSASREEVLTPLLNVISDFREKVRVSARKGELQGVMDACDDVRDNMLPTCGVRLEDKNDRVVWKLEDPEVLAREREQKMAEKERKDAEKAEKDRKAAEKAALARIPPEEWFRRMKVTAAAPASPADGVEEAKGCAAPVGAPLYTKFDDKGVPTHDAAGEPLTSSAIKRLGKEWKAQEKQYQKQLEQQTNGGAA